MAGTKKKTKTGRRRKTKAARKRVPKKAPPPSPSLHIAIDAAQRADLSHEKKLAAVAMQKTAAGERPTAGEMQAWRAYEKRTQQERAWDCYRNIPQKHWREMGDGWKVNQLKEQAALYDIPFGDAVVCLPDVVRGLRKFFARNASRLAKEPDDTELMVGVDSPAMERLRHFKAELAKLDYHERKRVLLDREEVRHTFSRMANLLRQAGVTLKRNYGAEAHAVLDEALTECERLLEQECRE